MAAPKFTKTQVEENIAKAAEMDRMGYNQLDIARALGCSQPQVSYYLKKVRDRYASRAVEDHKVKVEKKRDQFNHVLKESLNAWEESKKDGVTITTETRPGRRSADSEGETPDYVITTEQRRGQVGDPAFLNTAMKALDKEMELDGLTDLKKLPSAPQVNVGIAFAWESLNVALSGPVRDRVEEELAKLTGGNGDTLGLANPAGGTDSTGNSSILLHAERNGNKLGGDGSEEGEERSDSGTTD